MKIINDFVSWGFGSGFFIALIWFLWGYVKPLLNVKVKHAQTAQQRELLSLIEGLADTAVTSLVGRTDITGSDKFKVATNQVQAQLVSKGLSANEGTIQSAVQAAYEKSPLIPTSTQGPDAEPQTGAVIDGQTTDPVLQAVEEAPNRVNNVKGE